MPKKIKPSGLQPSLNVVPSLEDKMDEKISFSFNFLTTKGQKFNYKVQQNGYFVKLLERLKNYGNMTVRDVQTDRSSSTRCHPIEWVQTTETCFGIPREDEVCQHKYQLTVSANEHGRLHGFFIYNVFYVVWLDPNHELYS